MAKNIQRSRIAYVEPETENLIELFRDSLKRNSELEILINSDSGLTWTGNEVAQSIEILASYFINECNLKKGQICTIFLPANDQTAIIICAIIACGGIAQPVVPKPEINLVEIISSSQSNVFIGVSSDVAAVKVKLDATTQVQLICSDKSPLADCKILPDIMSKDFEKNKISLDELLDTIHIEPEKDIALVQFSSGTTGKSKRIPRTHRNLSHLVASKNHPELYQVGPGDVLNLSSFSARPGIWTLLSTIKYGFTCVTSIQYKIDDFFSKVQKYKVEKAFLPVFFLSQVSNLLLSTNKLKYDTSSLKKIVTNGSKILDQRIPETVLEYLKLDSVRQAFGMTESGSVFLIEESDFKDNYLSVGRPLPGVEVKIIDQKTGIALGPNQRGELSIRSPQVAPGYLTDEPGKLNRTGWTEDNFLLSGDEAYYDDQGLFFICGRYKEVMMTGISDSRFFPEPIEAYFLDHPSVASSCVMSLGQAPNSQFEADIVRAYIILRQGCQTSESELIEFIESRVYNFRLQGGIKFVDEFPTFPNGKINKKALKEIS